MEFLKESNRSLMLCGHDAESAELERILTTLSTDFIIDGFINPTFAIEQLAENKVDAIIVYMIKSYDLAEYIEIAKAIKNTKIGATTPVIACVKGGIEDDREFFLNNGFDGFIVVPTKKLTITTYIHLQINSYNYIVNSQTTEGDVLYNFRNS